MCVRASVGTVKVDDNLPANGVLVKMLAASISPSDLSQVQFDCCC